MLSVQCVFEQSDIKPVLRPRIQMVMLLFLLRPLNAMHLAASALTNVLCSMHLVLHPASGVLAARQEASSN